MPKELLRFTQVAGTDPRAATRCWLVSNVGGTPLGEVKWHSPWRRYVFVPEDGSLFDAECLAKIASHCGSETVAQKQTWKGRS